MIPRRIRLSGFLCYRDEQVIDLDGAPLWVFTGRNGSGKSAIFDAMTYALFNAHRGGKTAFENLIHADRDEMAVVFDFDLAGQTYRIRRSRTRRGRVEQQLFRHDPADDRWPAVADASLSRGLDAWVKDNIGLSYEAFTASVYLRQGDAEKLLTNESAVRFQLLSGIVNLDRYRRLGEAAEDKKKATETQAKLLRGQANAAPAIDPEAIAAAGLATAEAASHQGHAAGRLKLAQGWHAASREWGRLVERRDELIARRDQADALLAEADAIGRAKARLDELDAILPSLKEAIDSRDKIDLATATEQRFQKEVDTLAGKVDRIAALLKETTQAHATLVREADDDRAHLDQLQRRLADLAVPLDRARSARDRRAVVADLESRISAFPADPAASVDRIEAERRDRDAWKTALPALKRLARERSGLAETTAERAAMIPRRVDAEATRATRTREATAATAAFEAARLAERLARDQATKADTLADEADARLTAFGSLQGSPACDRCGQPLTERHLASEQARLASEAESSRQAARDADGQHAQTLAARNEAEAVSGDVARDVRAADQVASDLLSAIDRAEHDRQARASACAEAWGELDRPFRERIAPDVPADWLATSFPTADDLTRAGHQAAGLANADQRLAEARRLLADKVEALARLEQARAAIEGFASDPRDEATMAAEDASLRAEAASIEAQAGDRDQALASRTHERERLGEQVKDLEGQRTAVDRDAATNRAFLRTWITELDEIRSTLPDPWRPEADHATTATHAAWAAEQRSLRERGIDERAILLRAAPSDRDKADSLLIEANRNIDTLPIESRRPSAELEPLVEEAEADTTAANRTLRDRQVEEERLLRDRDDRLGKEQFALSAEGELAVAAELSRLLGRRGLQGHLLREAERGIVAQTNPILREVSGGELAHRLLDDEGGPDQVLRLVARVRTHGRTHEHELAYLSGSQRFRVAVSLALGIGRHAQGGRGPIGSVIIDEGFGSLDQQGRREMIDQLEALRGRLDRIILVSHQEEIADAFPDVYHFEVIDGSTEARPIRR